MVQLFKTELNFQSTFRNSEKVVSARALRNISFAHNYKKAASIEAFWGCGFWRDMFLLLKNAYYRFKICFGKS